MDVNMPKIDGIECTQIINKMFIENQYPIKPYIIGYSSYLDAETKNLCISSGMHDFLTKPCDKEVL
jgi:CheY-like chemotaxis protein